MEISFAKGFVKIPSMNKAFNPENVLTITENKDGSLDIIMQDCICIADIKSPMNEIAKICTIALNGSSDVVLDTKKQKLDFKA